MTNEFKAFKFPSYKEASKINKAFIDNNMYTGYKINIPVIFGLYMSIEFQNTEYIGMGENTLRFAWCNKAGFAITSQSYKSCEAGYLAGYAFLVESALELSKCFGNFYDLHSDDVIECLNNFYT